MRYTNRIEVGRTILLCVGILFYFGLAVCPVEAAVPTATLVGTVTDASGAVVPEVTVTMTHQGTGASRSLKSDSAGNFTFPLLPVGNYNLKAEKAGFQTFVQKDVVLQVDQNLTVPVVLQLGAVTQEVTVVGTTAGVDLLKSTVSEVVDSP